MDKILIDSFTKFKFLGNPKFSPNGKRFLFEATKCNLEKNSYETSLYSIENGVTKKLTTNSGSGYVFFNDDEIIFKDDREKDDKKTAPNSKFYKLNLTGGEAEKILEFDRNLSVVDIYENKIIFLENYSKAWENYSEANDDEKKKIEKQAEENKDYEVLDEIPFWVNGNGFTAKKRSRLAIYDIDSKIFTYITDELTDVLEVNPDKNLGKLVFTAISYESKAPLTNKIFMLNLSDFSQEEITPIENMSYAFTFIFGDNVITMGTDMKSHGINENGDFIIFNPKSKEILKRIHTDLSGWSSVGSDARYTEGSTATVDGDYFYFTSTIKYACELFRLDKDLNQEQLTRTNGSIDSIDVCDGKIYSIALIDQELQEVYEIKSGELNCLTKMNTELEGKYVAKPNLVEWNANGYNYTGFVLLPEHFDKNKKYPAVFEIHGGPKTVYGTVFYHELQYLANEGYIVFFTNPRGSDGYGNEFMDIFGHYGEWDYEDLMHFADLVMEKYPQIDKQNVFVTGGSYGGFMTNWIIGHTDRFKRACSQRSIANWISMWGTTDIGYYFATDQTDGDVWDKVGFEKMWNQSPLKYADKVKTPTLFIHSNEDYRCYHVEGIQMYTALKVHGIESRLVLFKGENHELSRSGLPKHRIRRLQEIRNWFK